MTPTALNAFASTPRSGLPKVKSPGMKTPKVKTPRGLKPMTPHTGFRSIMADAMPRTPGVRWK